MTYKEVTEGIDPIKKRIEQVRSRLNESKIQCVLTVNPYDTTMNKNFLSHDDDFAIFQEYQTKLINRLKELEEELEEYLNKTVY